MSFRVTCLGCGGNDGASWINGDARARTRSGTLSHCMICLHSSNRVTRHTERCFLEPIPLQTLLLVLLCWCVNVLVTPRLENRLLRQEVDVDGDGDGNGNGLDNGISRRMNRVFPQLLYWESTAEDLLLIHLLLLVSIFNARVMIGIEYTSVVWLMRRLLVVLLIAKCLWLCFWLWLW